MYIYICACLVVVVFFLLLLLEKKIRDHTPSLFILFVQLYRILYEYFSDCPASCLGLHSIDRSHYRCCCYEKAVRMIYWPSKEDIAIREGVFFMLVRVCARE